MNNKIAFTSNIKFISNEEFQRKVSHIDTNNENENRYIGVYDKRKRKNEPYFYSDAFFYNKAKTDKEGLTDSAFGCIEGGLTNSVSKEATFFHFLPGTLEKFEDTTKTAIYKNLEKMGAYTQKLGGLIIGGKSMYSSDLNASKSEKLAEKFKNFFDDLKVSYSLFTGQHSTKACTDVYYNGQEDTWFVNYKEEEHPRQNLINSPEDIKKTYNKISISSDDKVFINNKSIDKIELDQTFTKISNGFEISSSQNYVPYDERLKIYTGNYGQDKNILWVENLTEKNIDLLDANMGKIKESNMFAEVQKIQYAGDEKITGFEATQNHVNNKVVFERKV
jgi:hypothetical protein